MRKIALSLLIVCLLATPAHAGKQQQFSFSNVVTSVGQLDSRVDEQSWWLTSGTPDPNHTVTNPISGCSWDINDHSSLVANSGYLDPGQSASTGLCHIWDYNPIYQCVAGICANYDFRKNFAGIFVQATSPGLTVQVCFQPQGSCFTPAPYVVSLVHKITTYGWRFCGQAIYASNDSALQLIANSGSGGYGVVSSVSMTVTNQSASRVSQISAGWGLSSDVYFPAGCPSDDTAPGPNRQSSYPFVWSES